MIFWVDGRRTFGWLKAAFGWLNAAFNAQHLNLIVVQIVLSQATICWKEICSGWIFLTRMRVRIQLESQHLQYIATWPLQQQLWLDSLLLPGEAWPDKQQLQAKNTHNHFHMSIAICILPRISSAFAAGVLEVISTCCSAFTWHNSIPLLCTLESTKWDPKASHWFVHALVQHETFCHCPVLQNLNENRLVLSGSWCFSCLAWAEKQICLCPWPSMAQTKAPCLFSAWTCCFATAWNRLLSLRVLSPCHHLIKKSQVAYSCQVRHDPTNSNFKLKTPTIIFICPLLYAFFWEYPAPSQQVF